MLNYIWLALIVIGITVAVWTDVHDLSVNTYHNGEELSAVIQFSDTPALQPTKHYPCALSINSEDYDRLYGDSVSQVITQKAELIVDQKNRGVLHIFVDNQTPARWREMVSTQKNSGFLLAHVYWKDSKEKLFPAKLSFDPVKFVRLNAVTNDGIISHAKTAVELAIGLIGIMALWLGVMKIAEQAGLVAKLANVLKPITTRLFPDVPADHAAMGAMIMNISANMLGLSNAATPLGLKAMEELNKLNTKVGTATDAMCTFLVINTSNVQLIPATVIAIRAASGSSNPAEIIGPVLVATAIALIVGVSMAKLLAKLPVFRNQLQQTAG